MSKVEVFWTRKTPTPVLFERMYVVMADADTVRRMIEHAGPEAGPQLGLDWVWSDDRDEVLVIAAELRHRGYSSQLREVERWMAADPDAGA